MKTFTLAALVSLLAACAAPTEEPDAEQSEDPLLGRTTAQICNAVDARWGDRWQIDDPASAEAKRANVVDAVSCANRRYWQTRYLPLAVHTKYYLHRGICLANPASHFAMRAEQADFYCAFSLHFRMCNTQGLYAIKNVPDGEPRRQREREIFATCLPLSGEIPQLREGFRLEGKSDAEVASIVERLYDEYKVKPGVRIAPASVNPDRARYALLESIVRTGYYGVTVPLDLLETAFSDLFLRQEGVDPQSQLQLISWYRSQLMNHDGKNLLDASDL